jgi:Zn-dependent protease with chaperone function
MLALSATGPLVASLLLHDTHMAEHDPLLVCVLMPTFDGGGPVLLYVLSALLLAAILLASVTATARQWYRTRRLTRTLLTLHSPAAQQPWAYLLGSLHLEGKVDYVDADVPLAFCYGWLRPRILLARGAVADLDECELTALLLHERCHLTRRDPLKSALARTLSCVLFFLPAVRALYEQYLVSKEIEADRYVLRHQQSEAPLVSALYKLLSRNPGARASASATDRTPGVAVAGSMDCLNQRLDHLLWGTAPRGVGASAFLTSGVVLAVLLTATALASWDAASNAMWHQTACSLGTCPLMP